MTKTKDIQKSDCIDLPVHLDLTTCAPLRQEIEAMRGQPISLNAHQVDFLGAAGAELLLAAQAEWRASDLTFDLTQPSEGFLAGMDQLGLPHSTLIEGNYA